MKVITGENYSLSTLSLTEDTQAVDCNLCLCHVERNGFVFEHEGCNTHGLYIDGVKRDSFALSVWKRDEDAADFLGRVQAVVGIDGVDAWLWLVANATADKVATKTAFSSWAAEIWNATSFDFMTDWLEAFHLTDWVGLVGAMQSKAPDTWAGLETILVEEHS